MTPKPGTLIHDGLLRIVLQSILLGRERLSPSQQLRSAQEVGYAGYMGAFSQSTGNNSSHSTSSTIQCQVFGVVNNDFDTANKAIWSCKFTEAVSPTLLG